MERTFWEAVAWRRSHYKLSSRAQVSDKRVEEMLESALLYTPTPFNVQSARMVLLIGDQHRELWDIVENTLRGIVTADRFAATQTKIHDSFRNGRGTVLFYEDKVAIEQLKQRFPTYADAIDGFALQSSAMYQYVVWVGLEDMGYGASLQHYNPLIDDTVMRRWLIPPSWRLIAQMPFGTSLETPAPRVQTSTAHSRLLVF